MSPRHSKHLHIRNKLKAPPAPKPNDVNLVVGEPEDSGGPKSFMQDLWPGGFFVLDENVEGQIKRLKEATTFQRSSKDAVTAPPGKDMTTVQPAHKSKPLPPAQIQLGSDYEVLALLGQGGMGYVYKVKDKRKNQVVAVKVVRPELATDERAVKRFEQEAEAAMGLLHPNLVPVYGQGVTADGAPYLVMEYQEGTPLDKVLKQEKCIAAERAVDIFMQICDALEHAHAKGIVHRDLKPSNIVLTKTKGNKDLVRIVDFGIAKVLAGAESRETFDLTNTGDLFGSPSYMSPEQCMGYRLDARSDVYSLGCVMYEMLSGQPPFVSDNPVQTIVKHLSDIPQRLVGPQASSKDIPATLESLVFRCLEKDPRNRYQSMQQLHADLSNIQTGERPVYYARARESTSTPLSFVAAVAAVCVFNLVCLSAAFDQHERAIKSLADASNIISTSESITQLYDDAMNELGAYSVSKSPIFIERYNRAMSQLLVTSWRLHKYNPNNAPYQASVSLVAGQIENGMRALARSKELIENEGASDKVDGEGDKNANASKKLNQYAFKVIPIDQNVRNGLFELQESLLPVTGEARTIINGDPVRSSKFWLEFEVLALMLLNLYLILGPGKNLAAGTQKRIWQNHNGRY